MEKVYLLKVLSQIYDPLGEFGEFGEFGVFKRDLVEHDLKIIDVMDSIMDNELRLLHCLPSLCSIQ